MKEKVILLIAAVSGMLVIGLGAVGSHALEGTLTANNRLETYETAVFYHSFHTIALFCIGILQLHFRSKNLMNGAYIMISGIILFSGSLYLLSLSDKEFFAYITPFGGVLFLLSWALVFYGIYKEGKNFNLK
jgi:uncharacterized membrane protein YgdD (TMEM256/DUF423 family)